jgi:hypothetical protein
MAFRSLWSAFVAAGVHLAPALAAAQGAAAGDEARVDFFEKKVRPILVDNCYNCHSASTNSRGGLRVDDRQGLIHGGGRGPAVVPGQPDQSLLLQAVRHTHAEVKMPPKKQLAEEQVADLARWILDGAAWPTLQLPLSVGKYEAKYAKLRQEHWAWQPLREPQTPPVLDTVWPRDAIDCFIRARLEARGLAPVEDAPATTFIRRVSYDLTGLPPTPAEVERYLAALAVEAPTARAALVDRLLAAPAFGERWGRHWLDLARYGESTGSARNLPYPHAWRYRDYVIDAFNRDKPYDQFVREQIAGDLLPAASQQQRDAQLVATGFLALGVRDVNQRFKVRFVMDNIDEQIDVVGRALLGLTVSCARCHDHKFDPIPIVDYYALAGIFHSSDLCAGVRNKMGGGGLDYYDTTLVLPLGPERQAKPETLARIAEANAALAGARAELLALSENVDKNPAGPGREQEIGAVRKQIATIQRQLIALSDPAAHGPVALGVRDAVAVGDTQVRIRGEAEMLGPLVPRGFLSAFNVPGAARVNPQQSGRLELAQWLTSAHNPLTPRVLVNRVWHHLFGQGLVSSVDNFGVTGDIPSHPELLDHLATRFIEDGWSIKKLVRAIVLSRAYQLGSTAPVANRTADPDNRLVWRHQPRRLAAEEIRDTMLAVAGDLAHGRAARSLAHDLKVTEVRSDGPEAKSLEAEAAASKQRSIYLPLLRTLAPNSLQVFDFAEQGLVTGSRDATNVATQALYLLNDPFVRRQSTSLAQRLLRDPQLNDAGRIDLAYRLLLGRPATAAELERVEAYVVDYAAAAEGLTSADAQAAAWASFCQAMFASAEFRYVR